MTEIYRVTVHRWELGYELHVDDVGITQCDRLADAERMVRDYLATELGGQPETYAIKVHAPLM